MGRWVWLAVALGASATAAAQEPVVPQQVEFVYASHLESAPGDDAARSLVWFGLDSGLVPVEHAPPADLTVDETPSVCSRPESYFIASELLRRSVSQDGAGRDLDRVRLSLESAHPDCCSAVQAVTYHLQPSHSAVESMDGAASPGHALELDTWSFFPTWVEAVLASGEIVVVSGYVQWQR